MGLSLSSHVRRKFLPLLEKVFTVLRAMCTTDDFKKPGERSTTKRGCKTS